MKNPDHRLIVGAPSVRLSLAILVMDYTGLIDLYMNVHPSS